MSYEVGVSYFFVIAGWTGLIGRLYAMTDQELVFRAVRAVGSDGRWTADALARRYHIEPASECVIVRRSAIDFAVEVDDE